MCPKEAAGQKRYTDFLDFQYRNDRKEVSFSDVFHQTRLNRLSVQDRAVGTGTACPPSAYTGLYWDQGLKKI